MMPRRQLDDIGNLLDAVAVTAVAHAYRYATPSRLAAGKLALATSGVAAAPAPFLAGRLVQPRPTADWLLTVAQIVRSRFFTPPAMRERLILLADPVVTCSRQWLRFEGFSSCCSVYARLDLDAEAVDARERGVGTTNVDFGPEMRAALASLQAQEHVELRVGGDGVELARADATVVERKVELPLRWLRGLGEVQAVQARLERRQDLSMPAALRLLRSLPKTRAEGFLVGNGDALRLSTTGGPGGFRVGGAERLAVLEPIVRHAERVRFHGRDAAQSACAVVLERAHLRLSVVLSAAPWRGFSGEGALLRDLARAPDRAALVRVGAGLRWQEELALADRATLAWLAVEGRAGFDLTTGTYFHRDLPFDCGSLGELQPRLLAARELVAAGGVQGIGSSALVDSGGARYRLALDAASGEWTCTCPWYAQSRGAQGPCKHALAVQLLREVDG